MRRTGGRRSARWVGRWNPNPKLNPNPNPNPNPYPNPNPNPNPNQVSPAWQRLSGFEQREVVGRPLKLVQGVSTEAESVRR